MKLGMYSVYDNLAEVFNRPFAETNNNTAIRAYKESTKDNPNSKDFILYHIGHYNDNSGEMIKLENPVKISDNYQTIEKEGE